MTDGKGFRVGMVHRILMAWLGLRNDFQIHEGRTRIAEQSTERRNYASGTQICLIAAATTH